LLRQAEGILHRNPAFAPAESAREFRIIMSDYVATVLMSRAMKMLEKQAPNVSIRIETGGRRDALERGDADLVILPEQYLLAGHPKEDLFSDEFACLVCEKNRAVGNSLSIKTYLSQGHVVVRFGEYHDLPGFEQQILEAAGIHRKVAAVVSSFALVPQLVIGTTRIATIHRRLATYYARQLPLRVLKTPIAFSPMKEAMQWHTYREADPGLRWLRSVFQSAIAAPTK
jgi:DNA-binding transcriptional LysR family regulator